MALLGVTRDLENLDGVVVGAQVVVHADQDATARLDIALELLGGARDLPLEPAGFDSLDHATHRLDFREQAFRLALQLVGERLHEVGAAERVDHVRHAGLVRDDLLGPERQADRLLRGERERFVQ